MKDLLSLLPIVAIFLIFWLLVIRPASRRQKSLQAVQRSLTVGDWVITSSGFFGTIRTIEDDVISLEIASGVVVSIARAAIVGVPDEAEKHDTSDDMIAETSIESQTPEHGQ